MPKPFECSTGSFTGTGTTKTVTLGFEPNFLMIYDETSHDSVVWCCPFLADGKGIIMTTDIALLGSNGVTLSATGFSVGSDVSVNNSGDTIVYFALGGL